MTHSDKNNVSDASEDTSEIFEVSAFECGLFLILFYFKMIRLVQNAAISRYFKIRTSSLKKKNERIQFFILFSIVIIFVFCNIPRITLLVHQVIIIDTIK